MELSNNPDIKGVGADIQLDETSALTIAESLTGGPYVIDGVANRVFATGTYAEESIDYFELADDLIAQGYVIVAEDGGLKAIVKHEHEGGTNFETKWDKSDSLPSKAGSYFLTTDVMLTSTVGDGVVYEIPGDVKLCLNGHKIEFKDNYSADYLISISGNNTLTVYDCDPDEKGEIVCGFTGATIRSVESNFILESGKITNNRDSGYNGDTISLLSYSNGAGSITINGGTVSSICDDGIYAMGGYVTITGGSVTSDNSYAIEIPYDSYLDLSGNPTIKGGKGDIYAWWKSTPESYITVRAPLNGTYSILTKKDDPPVPIIKFANGERAEDYLDSFTSKNPDYSVIQIGSELWLVPKDAHVHDDGTIFLPWDGNTELTEDNYYIKDDMTLLYSRPTITDDVSLCLNGYTLDCDDFKINIEGGSLTVCDCSEAHSGTITSHAIRTISVENSGKFTLESGKIVSSSDDSYAINIDSGSVTINGGFVEGCYAIYASNSSGDVTVTGGEINGGNREGVYLQGGTLAVSGGKITSSGTYAIYPGWGEFSLSGNPEIIGTEADICLGEYSEITIDKQLTTAKPYTIELATDDESIVFAEGACAADSKGCFKLTADFECEGYEIAIEGETLVARLKTYTITYEPGEGSNISGDSFTRTKAHGEDITISSEKFTRPGYTQIGWSTKKGASEVEYAFGYDYTENADLTLYPVWKKNEIHFYKGDEKIESLSLKVGESAEISAIITPDSAERGQIIWTAEGMTINKKIGDTVTVTGDSAGEFELTATTDGGLTTKTLIVTVSRSTSTVSAVNQTVTYDDEVTITVKVEKAATNGISLMSLYDNKVTFKIGDTVLGEADVDGDTATLTIPATRANGFAIGDNTVTLEYGGNGELDQAEGSVTVTVNKKTLTATITGTTTKTYDGTTDAEGLELKLTGVVEGDTVGASAVFAYDSANAGYHNITTNNAALTGEQAGYYELSTPISTSGTISPLPAELVWTDDEFTYDGASHTVTATVENAVGNDKFEIKYANNSAVDVGNYTAKVTSLGNTNYTLAGATGVEHEWKITAASQAAPEVKIDFINETLSTDETMEFSVDGETWLSCSAAMNVAKAGWNGSALTVKIRYKKDVDHLDGEIQSLVIPARRATPDISETTVSKSQTEISIAEIPGCEYSLDGLTWQDSGSFSELDKGETYEIHVRYKATASAFASFISQKTVVTSSTADGTTELLPGETVAAGDGSIKNLGGEIIIDDGAGNVTTVTLPDGGSVEVDEQGCVTVPGGGEVSVGDNPAVSLPKGGKVEPDGTVIADEVKVGNTDVKGEDVTVAPDGKITLPEGGKVSADGELEKIVPAGTTVENGKINAPAIAEPADGSESLGDDIILKIEAADERLEVADRENFKDTANAIVHEVYDIELLKNGAEIQPDKSIKLTVSTDVSGAKMKVFMLDDDGKFTEIEAEFDTENGTFSVVTDSLGIFILASEEGQITSEVVASGGAPEVEISDDDRKILEENLFTDEDETAIENGDNVKVVMNVEEVSEEDIPADDIAEIEAFLDDLESCEIAEYADITLKKITEDGVTGDEIRSETIAEINNPIKLVLDIPEALHKAGRIFSVIRLHDGKAELLNDTDQSDETVTILTDKFSLYVLIYRDPASQPSHVHSLTAWINVGAGGHLARCAICGKVMSLMPHTMLNGVCTACGYSAIFSQPFDESDVIEIEVPTEGMIANEEVVEF